jgi:hypothetical protein
MLFHPGPDQPRPMPASCGWSWAHGFAQVWFILKGEFTIDGRLCPPGTMLHHPDPHFEGLFHTASGGEILIVQYPGRRPASGRSMPGALTWSSGRRSPRSASTSETPGPALPGSPAAAVEPPKTCPRTIGAKPGMTFEFQRGAGIPASSGVIWIMSACSTHALGAAYLPLRPFIWITGAERRCRCQDDRRRTLIFNELKIATAHVP